jgi:hypothetical protein
MFVLLAYLLQVIVSIFTQVLWSSQNFITGAVLFY